MWLLFDAVFDPYKFGSGLKGVAERIGIALTGLAYGRIGWSAVKVLVGTIQRASFATSNARVLTCMNWPARGTEARLSWVAIRNRLV